MNSWIRHHSNGQVDSRQLSMILVDIHNGEIDLSGFFTVTIGFAGAVSFISVGAMSCSPKT